MNNMKRVQKLILILVGMTIIFSCNSNHQKGDINLNNGEKWKVNSEMTPHIEKGSEILNAFISQHDKDYLKLAESLKEQNEALIQSCTMKGESHDELHKWLHPHMELIEELANAKDFNEAEPVITKLENSFKTFHNHFQ